MGYRFGGMQKKLSFGPYPVVTLAEARIRRDAAKTHIAQGVDPGKVKKDAKSDAKTFGEWADEWIAKEEVRWDKKTMGGKVRFVGYLKAKFGTSPIPLVAVEIR